MRISKVLAVGKGSNRVSLLEVEEKAGAEDVMCETMSKPCELDAARTILTPDSHTS